MKDVIFLVILLVSIRAFSLEGKPLGVENKNPIDGQRLAKKSEGSYFTGIAGVTSGPDAGVGFAAVLFYYINGSKDEPYFAYSDYKHRIHASALVSTRGIQSYSAGWDAPFFSNSLFRLKALFEYTQRPNLNYYGMNSKSLRPFNFNNNSYSTYENFQKALTASDTVSVTNAYYDKYKIDVPRFKVFLEREMLGGWLRPQVGFLISKYKFTDYTNQNIELSDGTVKRQLQTKLSIDQANGELVGIAGGYENIIRVGVAFDTRNVAANPSKGMFHDFVIDLSGPILGSQYNYISYSLGLRGFYSLLDNLVIASRFMYTIRTPGSSFYSLGNISSTSVFDIRGLGGFRSIRGFRQGRFRGNVITFANVELRYTFWGTKAWGQHFDFMIVPFIDSGSVFDSLILSSSPITSPWPFSAGLALRIVWNQATVIMFDYAKSSEDSGFYINIGQIF